jgi:hypothetical protein
MGNERRDDKNRHIQSFRIFRIFRTPLPWQPPYDTYNDEE